MIVAAAVVALVALMQGEGPRVKETAFARVTRAEAIAHDPAVRDAVVASNAAGETREQVRRRDSAWIANKGDPLRQAIVQAPCSARVRELVKEDALIVEAFVMNDHGTLVCSMAETSDYWQGDEAKWQRTFVDGRNPFVDEPAFDASTGKYAIQVSVPLSAGDKRIGAVTLTLKLGRQDTAPPAKD